MKALMPQAAAEKDGRILIGNILSRRYRQKHIRVVKAIVLLEIKDAGSWWESKDHFIVHFMIKVRCY